MVRIALLASIACLGLSAGKGVPLAGLNPRDGVHPLVFETPTGTFALGNTVGYTVDLSGAALGNEAYTVTGSTGSFSALPTTIYPTAGSTKVSFSATISSGATGSVTVTVTYGTYQVSKQSALDH